MNEEEFKFCRKVVCAGAHPVKYLTFQIMERIVAENVPGDMAECGVMAGAHPAIMSYVLRKYGIKDRKIRMYDSFEGIPMKGPEDDEGTEVLHGQSKVSMVDVDRYMVRWGVDRSCMTYHPGWFEESLERYSNDVKRLALLRIDADLYESVLPCFRWLYPKVVPGGFVIFDDYGFGEKDVPCRKAMKRALTELGLPHPKVTRCEGNIHTGYWRIPKGDDRWI